MLDLKRALAIAMALAVAACASMDKPAGLGSIFQPRPAPETAAEAPAPAAPAPAAVAELPPEPGLKFGRLPNGMRYADPAQRHARRARPRCACASTPAR